MAPDQPWTGSDRRHNGECARRWATRRNRDTADPAYPEQWYREQCGGCRYWIALRGSIGHDFGLCSHAAAPYDGQARFEHDGCTAFTRREDASFG